MAIPASTIVSVNPSVLNPGGTGLVLAAMFLTQNTDCPLGAPTSFSNLTAVGELFGTTGTEYTAAKVYFQGYDTSNIKPGLLWFAQFPSASIGQEGAFMDALLTYTSNWASLMTVWEPALAAKKSFAAWVSGKNTRYVYVASDSDTGIIGSPSAYTNPATQFGPYLHDGTISGTVPVYNSPETAAMICGMIASIDFTQLNGRVNFMFKTNSQVPAAVVTDLTEYENMIANGFSTYCQFGVQQSPNMLANGQISGPFLWIDSYVNALYLAVSIQQAEISLLQQQKSLPYNPQGYALISAAAQDPINAALNFGTIRPNTPPNASQSAQMDAAAGTTISDTVGTRGWYFQVQPASATTRAARQSPPISLWYMDGQSVQQINIASVDVL